jgi:hypothetical protein
MSNASGKSLDKTHLSIDIAEKRLLIHRDYLAHTLRWTHVARALQRSGAYKTATVLDVGCGKELPLAKMLYSNRLMVQDYVGLDANKPDTLHTDHFANGKFPLSAYGNAVFPRDLNIDLGDTPGINVCGDWYNFPTHIVSFEVIEHIEPLHVIDFLNGVRNIMKASIDQGNPSPVFYLSTPCYDGKNAAANHVNEMSYILLYALLESIGFTIDASYGTFASIYDYKDQLEADGYGNLFEQMRDYYDTNFLSLIFAPLYPHLSRNALWVLRYGEPQLNKQVFELSPRHSSSEHWRDFAKTLNMIYAPEYDLENKESTDETDNL